MRRASRHATTGRVRPVRLVPLLLLSGLICFAALPSASSAQSEPAAHRVADPYAAHIAEASHRFRIPERWIRAVMQVESAGRVDAVSSAGAMGLMQIMPDTWAGLRVRHHLGDDPFDPRDNILGGTAYLREIYNRFGSPGFLAAYNAGPERYQQHLDTGRPLPRETRAYVATLAQMLGFDPLTGTTTVAARQPDWREAPLFVGRWDRAPTANRVQIERGATEGSPSGSRSNDSAQDEPAHDLFVTQSGERRSP